MGAARKLKVVKSVQAEPKRYRRNDNSTAALQRKTVRKAHRVGIPWDDDEVARLVAGIERDETTFEMAIALGRTLYGTSAARGHVRFAMSHRNALFG